MKKTLTIIALLNCVWLFAQSNHKAKYSLGLKVGYSFHTLSGDLTKSRHGQDFIGGCWFRIKMNKNWAAQSELLLIDKGIGFGPGATISNNTSSHVVRLHYFEVPVLIQYHSKQIYYEFGPALGYLINYAEHLNGNASPDLVYPYPFIRNEISFNVGLGCTLNEKWMVGIRLSHSLMPVRGAVPLISKTSYNRLLALSISRRLMKKKTSDTEE